MSGQPQAVGNWIANDLLRELGKARTPLAQSKVRPAHVAGLVQLLASGAILGAAAKEVFRRDGRDRRGAGGARRPAARPQGRDQCAGDLDGLVVAGPRSPKTSKSLADFKAGKDSAINGFKGSVMRAAKGKRRSEARRRNPAPAPRGRGGGGGRGAGRNLGCPFFPPASTPVLRKSA